MAKIDFFLKFFKTLFIFYFKFESKGKKASTEVKKSSGATGVSGQGDELNRTASTTNLNTSLDEGNPSKPKDSVILKFDQNLRKLKFLAFQLL